MSQELNLPRGNCASCGKVIPIKDIRSKKAEYCNQICSSLSRFKTRYRGTMSGPADRPRFNEKGEKIH